MILNYAYRIYPDARQKKLLLEWLEICRKSYNYALKELKDYIGSRKCAVDRCSLVSEYIIPADYPFPGYHQQPNNLPSAKKKNGGNRTHDKNNHDEAEKPLIIFLFLGYLFRFMG